MSGSRWRRAVAVVGSAAFAACVFHDGKKPAGDGGIIPDVPPDVAPECLDTSVTCVGNMVRDCSMGGSAVVTSCEFGCVDIPDAHCGVFTPYGGAVGSADVVTAVGSDLSIASDVVIDSNNGHIGAATWGFWRLDTISGVKISVFRADNISIGSGATVTFAAGAGGKPSVAFVATGDITINGTLDGRPNGTCSGKVPGPGGFPGGAKNASAAGSGAGSGANGTGDDVGGGGGGYGGAGGTGGDGGTGTAGGAPFGDQLIMLLVGGGGGGGGGTNGGGEGGGGGAAFQLVAGGTITINGTINAGGCGGAPGDNNESGGGGGAGGSILLEAKAIVVGGVLAANGGGGGGGGGSPTRGDPGESGSGRAAAGTGDGDGGRGGAAMSLDGDPGAHNNEAGGGGGGVGRIRINTIDGNATTTGATISPTLGSGAGVRATKGLIRVQ